MRVIYMRWLKKINRTPTIFSLVHTVKKRLSAFGVFLTKNQELCPAILFHAETRLFQNVCKKESHPRPIYATIIGVTPQRRLEKA